MVVKVGTCGWSAKGGRREYFKYFSVVEIQQTFYRLPRESTASRWREQAPPEFEFTVKAWQAITHSPSSPTWRRSGLKLSPEERERYGLFRLTEEVLEAWNKTRRICEILRSRVCIFQTPPSFGFSEENAKRVVDFFSVIDRGGLKLGWEPRGTWHDNPQALRKVLEKADVTHVVDPLRREPVFVTDVVYFRLHGLGGREVNYRYKYTDEDLVKLKSIVGKYSEESPVYVMFNNVYMFDDALRFKRLLERGEG